MSPLLRPSRRAWRCFACNHTVTEPRGANIEWQFGNARYQSYATVRLVHKTCYGLDAREWFWCGAEAFVGARGLVRATTVADLAYEGGADATWLIEGSLAHVGEPDWESRDPGMVEARFPWGR